MISFANNIHFNLIIISELISTKENKNMSNKMLSNFNINNYKAKNDKNIENKKKKKEKNLFLSSKAIPLFSY